MVSKTKYPAICNNCGKKSEFYIRAGSHTLQLCGTCLKKVQNEAQHLMVGIKEQLKEYNNSVETGLIVEHQKPCSPQMIAEADCNNDPDCKRCFL